MIRPLERRAKGGNLLSAFELYQQYTQNKDSSEVHAVQAEQWFDCCWDYLQDGTADKDNIFRPENMFYLRSMKFVDFRRFAQLDIQFESDLTVIIGNNGRGKSSILSAVAKTLSWFSANILKEDGVGQRFNEATDIKNDSNKKYTDVITNFYFGQGLKNIPVRLSRSASGSAERRDSDVKKLKKVSDIWRVINDKKMVNLPNFQLFMVERSQPLNRLTRDSTERREARFDAYTHALTGAGRFDHFIEWFIALHKRTANDTTSSVEMLTRQVKELQLSVDNGLLTVKPLLEQAEKQLHNLLLNSHKTDIAQKENVVKAICNVVPSISKIWVETDSGTDVVKVTNDDHDVTIDQLSDGQRVFLALVADIARRMVMLNPLLDNPFEGRGIVLIDEIELHLHPKWQQDVIPNLRSVFPNLQFIITTHSPIVLSTVDRRNVRVFAGENENGEETLISPEYQTKGVINSDILEQIMGVFAAPPKIEESHWVSNFEILIQQGGFEDNPDAQGLYKKIKSHFGENSFELKQCDSLTRIWKMKQKALNRCLKKD